MTPRTPAAGIAYALWLHGRFGVLASVAATLALAAVASQAGPIPRIVIDMAAGLAFAGGLVYLVRVVTYGSADLSTPESGYPRHRFVFPVRTRALVGVPMFCGAVAAAILWAALAPLAFAGTGQPVPRLWPAATMAAVIAWLQAISWTPYRWSFVRVFLAIGLLMVFIMGGIAAHELGVGDWAIAGLTILAGASAYPVSVRALSRARRGDGVEPKGLPWRIRASAAARPRPPLPSAARAQLWFEVRRNMWLLPLLTAAFALGSASVSAAIRHDRPNVLLPQAVPAGAFPVLVLLGLPVFTAMIYGGGFGKFDVWSKSLTFPAFVVARPISTAAIVGAKLRAAALATVLGWASVLLVLCAYIWVPGTYDPKRSLATVFLAHATPRGVAVACLFVVLLIVWTWRMIVQGLWVPLLGREWIGLALPMIQLFATGAIGWAAYKVYADPRLHAAAAPWLRTVLMGLAICKLVAAAITFAVIRRLALMSAADVLRVACLWTAVLIGLDVAAFLLLRLPLHWAPVLVPATVLFVPLVRPALAIPALRQNRHRRGR
jgi:hypothetical protein